MKKKVEKILNFKFRNHKKYLKIFTKIDYLDLYNLHHIITQNNRIKVIEFGSGISTFIFSDAMDQNAKYFNKMKKKKFFKNFLDKRIKYYLS